MPKRRHLTTLITARCVLCDHLREKIDCKIISEEQVKAFFKEECTHPTRDRKTYHYTCLYCFKKYKLQGPLINLPATLDTSESFLEKIKHLGWTRELD